MITTAPCSLAEAMGSGTRAGGTQVLHGPFSACTSVQGRHPVRMDRSLRRTPKVVILAVFIPVLGQYDGCGGAPNLLQATKWSHEESYVVADIGESAFFMSVLRRNASPKTSILDLHGAVNDKAARDCGPLKAMVDVCQRRWCSINERTSFGKSFTVCVCACETVQTAWAPCAAKPGFKDRAAPHNVLKGQ